MRSMESLVKWLGGRRGEERVLETKIVCKRRERSKKKKVAIIIVSSLIGLLLGFIN